MQVWLVWNEDPTLKLLMLLMGLPSALAGRKLIGIYAKEDKARHVASQKTGYVVERAEVLGAQLRNPAADEAGNSEQAKANGEKVRTEQTVQA
jgi:hypothetical protein